MSGISIKEKTVLVTGSNRGIGKSFVLQALAMGAKKVYATARDESTLAELVELNDSRLTTLSLDVSNQAQVDAAAHNAIDVEILINNSGVGGIRCISRHRLSLRVAQPLMRRCCIRCWA